MLRKTLGALTGAVVIVTLAAANASAYQLPPRTYYFNCANISKVQSPAVNSLSPQLGSSSWSLAKPTASVSSGAGCGQYDSALAGTGPSTIYDAFWSGVHDEPVERVDVTLFAPAGTAAGAAAIFGLDVRLTVAGVEAQRVKNTPVVMVPGPTPGADGFTFSFKNLKIPGGTKLRPIQLTVDGISGTFFWSYGAAEIPSSITFTPPVTQ